MRLIFFICLISFTLCQFKSERLLGLENQIMAPCCFGGVLAEHDSEIAKDLKLLLSQLISTSVDTHTVMNIVEKALPDPIYLNYFRSNIDTNMSDTEIVNLLVNIYGERLRAAPLDKGLGVLAWKFPGIILTLGFFLAIIIVRSFNTSNKGSVPISQWDAKTEKEILEKLQKGKK